MAIAFLISTIMLQEQTFDLTDSAATPSAAPNALRVHLLRKKAGGFTMLQAVVAMGVIAVAGAAGMMALLQLNKKADAMRTLNNARAIVQRNIDLAMNVTFNSTTVPAILTVTSPTGQVVDDDGGGDGLVNIVTPKTAGGQTLKGTLTRIVATQVNPDGVNIRRVTFRINYSIGGRGYSYSMTTLRGTD